jgi:F-type H+-transporting ATPase subunit b
MATVRFVVAFFVAVAVFARPLSVRAAEDEHESLGGGGVAAAHDDGHAAGNQNPLSVDPDLAIVTAIIFLVLLIVLWKFAWGPIIEALDRREKGIADHIAAAERSHAEAKSLLADHERRLAGAADEVRGLLDQARRDADAQKQLIVTEAQQAARKEKERALREIDAAKNVAVRELAEKSVNTAVGLAGRIVRQRLNADDHAELI